MEKTNFVYPQIYVHLGYDIYPSYFRYIYVGQGGGSTVIDHHFCTWYLLISLFVCLFACCFFLLVCVFAYLLLFNLWSKAFLLTFEIVVLLYLYCFYKQIPKSKM